MRRNGEGSEGRAMSSDRLPRAALSAIVNELAECDGQAVLILDDLHHAFSEAVRHFLESLVSLAPPNCHFLFASRDYLWVGQQVLAAEEQLLVTGANVLRFLVLENESMLKIRRAHVCTPVTKAQIECRILLENKNKITT